MEIDPDGSIVFPPYHVVKGHILGTTLERVHLKPGSRLAARVEGRSSLARLGLIVHLTAPTIHHGFNGTIALEMINFSAFHLRLVPEKTVICQLILEMLDRDPQTGEPNTAFQGQAFASGDR
jgi:dCTP deaminase